MYIHIYIYIYTYIDVYVYVYIYIRGMVIHFRIEDTFSYQRQINTIPLQIPRCWIYIHAHMLYLYTHTHIIVCM